MKHERRWIMKRWAAALIVGVLLAPTAIGHAQDTDPEATISALQTRVSDLERQLAPESSPTPNVEAATSNDSDNEMAGAVGPATDLMPSGEMGRVDVVAVGAFQEGKVPVVVRNNTDARLAWLEVSADVRDANGQVSQTANGLGMKPLFVDPGELAIGGLYFQQPVAETDSVTIRAKGNDDVSLWQSMGAIPVELVEFNDLGGRVTGSIRNNSSQATTDNAYIELVCFDETGVPLWSDSAGIEDGIRPGEIAAFEFGKYGAIPIACDQYLFGGYSYAK